MTGIDPSFVRNLAMTSLQLGVCRLQAPRPDIAGAAQAIGQAVQLAARNRSVRLAELLRQAGKRLEPWHDLTEVQHVRERMVSYGLA